MKKLYLIIILIFTIQTTYSQDCTMYHIKCTGKINTNNWEIKNIELPTFKFLLGEEENPILIKDKFVQIYDNKIDTKLCGFKYDYYHYWSNPKKLLQLFKTKRKTLPIIIVAIKNGKEHKFKNDLQWDNIELKKGIRKGIFEMKLNDIRIE